MMYFEAVRSLKIIDKSTICWERREEVDKEVK